MYNNVKDKKRKETLILYVKNDLHTRIYTKVASLNTRQVW